MNRRTMLTTLGATALGVGVLIGGAATSFAQDAATPPASTQTDTQALTDPQAEFEAARKQAYDDFVAALAGQLGDDEAAVDAAIRTALTQAVDAGLAAGEIDEERAAAAKAVIQVSDAPLMAGFGGPGGPGGFKGLSEGRGHGGSGFSDKWREKGMPFPGDDDAPSALPTAPDAPDAGEQSASAPVTASGDALS